MAIKENDIGLVSYNEFDSHQKNSDTDIQHVTAAEKEAWDSKADGGEANQHKTNPVLDHPDESVTTPKIADGAVTYDKLDPATVKTPLDAAGTHAQNKTNPHGVTKTQVGLGNVDNTKQAPLTDFNAHKNASELDHPDGSVSTRKLADGGVTDVKIADGAVKTDKLADGGVTTSKLGDKSVTEGKVADGAITNSKIGNGAVTGTKIGTGAITASKIDENAVTEGKVAAGAISDSKLSAEVKAEIAAKEKSENKGQAGGYAPLDDNGKIPDAYLYGVNVKQYGVRWKGTSSCVCERLGDAAGLVANAHLGTTDAVQNDFNDIYPWSHIRTCNIDAEGNILAYAGEPSFMRDGTNGDVMVEIPKFYYKRVKTELVEEWWICGVKLPGYELHPLFYNDGVEVSKVFHSAYNANSFVDEADSKTKLRSISGVHPRVRTTRANFRNYARNKGANWGIEDIACIHALQMLYLVEYANTNSQAKLGNGASNLSYTANHKALQATESGNSIVIAYSFRSVYKVGQSVEVGTSQGSNNITSTPRLVTAVVPDEENGICTISFDGDPVNIAVGNMIWNVAPINGTCDELNGESGYIGTNGLADVNYRGIEGFHGKNFRFIDGVNIKDRVVHYANSTADYADGVYDGKYRAIGYTNANANGYVSEFGYDEKAPWVMFPVKASGGSTTYLADYYYQNSGERLLLIGGTFHNGTNGGVFYFYCYNDFSSAALHCGSHLLIKKP